ASATSTITAPVTCPGRLPITTGRRPITVIRARPPISGRTTGAIPASSFAWKRPGNSAIGSPRLFFGHVPFGKPRFAVFLPQALVAQLDRASDFDSEGREFESLRARHSTHDSADRARA